MSIRTNILHSQNEFGFSSHFIRFAMNWHCLTTIPYFYLILKHRKMFFFFKFRSREYYEIQHINVERERKNGYVWSTTEYCCSRGHRDEDIIVCIYLGLQSIVRDSDACVDDFAVRLFSGCSIVVAVVAACHLPFSTAYCITTGQHRAHCC